MADAENEGLAKSNVDNSLNSLLRHLGEPSTYELWVTGDTNFRHGIYPEYKANRIHTPRPRFLQACKKHLVENYGAKVSEGCEADDMLGVVQTQLNTNGVESMISSIDKDLDQIAGWHHSPELRRQGAVIKPERTYLVSPLEGLRFFYYQMLIGDPTDGIKGVVGCGHKAATRLLTDLVSEQALFDVVREQYNCDEEMLMNGQCLHIWQSMHDVWQFPFND